MRISIGKSESLSPLRYPRRFKNFLKRVVEYTSYEPVDSAIDFIFLDDEEMTELNGLHLNHEGTTDVITYDLRPAEPGEVSAEIYICPSVAEQYGKKFSSTVSREICLYAIHGLLHLTGHDDLTEEARLEMRAAESQVMEELGHRFDLDVIAQFI